MTEAPARGRIRDARGRVVSQLDPVALRLLQRDSPIERDALARIVREPGIALSGQERALLIGSVVCAIAIAGFFVESFLTAQSLAQGLRGSVHMLYLLILPFIIWGGAKKLRMTKVTAALLRHHRCPHCGYDLERLPADPADGATVCPECGCAWTLPIT